jgi:hypothetical protein
MLSLGESPTKRSASAVLGVVVEVAQVNCPPRHRKSARQPPLRAPDPSLPTMEKKGGRGRGHLGGKGIEGRVSKIV